MPLPPLPAPSALLLCPEQPPQAGSASSVPRTSSSRSSRKHRGGTACWAGPRRTTEQTVWLREQRRWRSEGGRLGGEPPLELLRFLGQSRPLPTPRIPGPPWNSLWQLSQVRPFWNPAPFMPGFEPTEMIWLGFGLVLIGAGVGRKEFKENNPFLPCLYNKVPCPLPSPNHRAQHSLGEGEEAAGPCHHSLGGDVDLFQFAVCFCRFQSLLQEEGQRRVRAHLSRRPLAQPPGPGPGRTCWM